jgi:hypothetical protein
MISDINLTIYLTVNMCSVYIFLLKFKKQASDTVHCGYYVYWYMLCNTNEKYTKAIIEHGDDVSISNLNYGFSFFP